MRACGVEWCAEQQQRWSTGRRQGFLEVRAQCDGVAVRLAQVVPKRQVGVLGKQVRRQHSLAGLQRHLWADAVQSAQSQVGVEFGGVEVDPAEIVFELGFAQKLVDEANDRSRGLGQEFVVDQKERVGVFAIERFLKSAPRIANEPIGPCEGFDAALHGVALKIVVEKSGDLVWIGTVQPLDTVHDPGHVANAGNDFGMRKLVLEQLQMGAPHTIGVKDHCFVRLVGVVGVEHPAH